ncbi:MAG TPA: hypothetical protein VIW24_30125 [Aldersonia sp.]
MKTPLKLGGFIVALAAVLALSFGIGNAVGPVGQATANTHSTGEHDMTNDESSDDEAGPAGPGDSLPGGLMVSDQGYALDLDSTILDKSRTGVKFRILGPDGQPLTDFEPTHDAKLHFFAVQRDMSGFRHLHPTMDESGAWSIDVDLTPGVWRLLADFRPAGHETITLGRDAFVAGAYTPQPLPPVGHTAAVGHTATGDDYTVTLNGQLVPGESSELTLTVNRNGRPVTDLEPYLAAYGHLVALRSGDLAYLHVHPKGEPGDGTTAPEPDVTFFATAPSAGAYRLYLDFKHDGVVRTAEFTAQAAGTARGSGETTPVRPEDESPGDHEHN